MTTQTGTGTEATTPFKIVNDGTRTYPWSVLHECGKGFNVWFQRKKDAEAFIVEIMKVHDFKDAETLTTLDPKSELGTKLRTAINSAADRCGAMR